MAGRRKRKPDLRRIRTTKTYMVPEIAIALRRTVETVRRWLREGLPTIDDQQPPLIRGAVLKNWLTVKWEKKKRPCQAGELYCCKCGCPRKPEEGSFSIAHNNEKTITLSGRCVVCGTRMSQAGSKAKETEIREAFGALPSQKQHLDRCVKPSAKGVFSEPPDQADQKTQKSAQLSLDF